ncbi:MAG: sigma-70 family RNA polymerase sigma factor [Archangium sp.]
MSDLRLEVRSLWQRFLDLYEPQRPALYRYCRQLTGTPWDAEDLTQDTLLRAFGALGTLFQDVPKPRAWLFRIASNLWVDRTRRSKFIPPSEVTSLSIDPRDVREAAGELFAQLSPQERAALVLKESFDLSLGEISEVLNTTVGAVKAALHRGRARVENAAMSDGRKPAREVLDAFCAAFNSRDLDGMTALLLEHATVRISGVVTELGDEAPKHPQTGSFAGTLTPITIDERGGVGAEFLSGYQGAPPTCEVREYRGEPILLFWYAHDDGPAVRTVMRVETEAGRLSEVTNFFFSPELLADVCGELGVPFRVNGYRYWVTASTPSS